MRFRAMSRWERAFVCVPTGCVIEIISNCGCFGDNMLKDTIVQKHMLWKETEPIKHQIDFELRNFMNHPASFGTFSCVLYNLSAAPDPRIIRRLIAANFPIVTRLFRNSIVLYKSDNSGLSCGTLVKNRHLVASRDESCVICQHSASFS